MKKCLPVFIALICLSAAKVLVAAPPDLLMHSLTPSSGGAIWLGEFQHIDDHFTPAQDQTALWERGIMGVGVADWSAVDPIGQRIISMANVGSELAVLGDDGEWFIVSEDGESRNGPPPPAPVRFVTFASDGETLWALGEVTGGMTGLTTPTTQPDTESTTQPTTQPTTQTAAVPDDLILFQFSGADWQPAPPTLPIHLPPDAGFVSLAVIKGQPWVAYTTNGNGPLHLLRLDNGSVWTQLKLAIPLTPQGSFKLLNYSSEPWLWVSQGSTGFGDLYCGDNLSRHLTLKGSGDTGSIQSRAVTVAGGHIKMMILNGDGKLLEQDFSSDIDSPDFAQPVGQVAAPMSPVEEQIDIQPWLLIAVTMILVACASAFSHRRKMPQLAAVAAGVDQKEPWAEGPPTTPTRLRLATGFLRIAAGAIDATPLMLWVAHLCDPSVSARTMAALADPQIAIPGLIALAGYLLHTTLSELICGATLGKMLFGLQVVTTGGKPPAAIQIVIRNFLRLLDLTIFPLVFMFLTPLRQRLGDLAAGTVVIEPDAPPPTDQEEDSM